MGRRGRKLHEQATPRSMRTRVSFTIFQLLDYRSLYRLTASAIARLPSSKRKRATRSASAPTSDAASTSHMSAADLKKEKSKLAMRAKRAKAKAEKEAAAAAAGGEPKPKEKAKRKVSHSPRLKFRAWLTFPPLQRG